MNRQGLDSGLDRETRRWVFDAVAWLAGIAMAALLVAEAAAVAPTVAPTGTILGVQQHAATAR